MVLKPIGAILIASLCLSAAFAQQPGGVGFGLILGEPTGFSLKFYSSNHFAYDAALGYSWYRYGQSLHIHGDLLWNSRSLTDSDDGFLPLYIGIGARVKLADEPEHPDTRLGLRIPFGLEYVFPRVPLGLFLEIVPIFELVPGTGLTGNSAIGFRYYFGSHY